MNLNGWDTHFAQEANFPNQAVRLNEALKSIDAHFLKDPNLADRFVFYFYSEFGRILQENGTNGTDHGFGGVHILVGKSLAGYRYKGINDYYPENQNSEFYKTAEGKVRLRMAKIIDIRAVQSQLLLFAGL